MKPVLDKKYKEVSHLFANMDRNHAFDLYIVNSYILLKMPRTLSYYPSRTYTRERIRENYQKEVEWAAIFRHSREQSK